MASYFETRERALLGDEEYKCLYKGAESPARGITVNTLRMPAENFAALVDFPIIPSPFCKVGFLVQDATLRLGTHALHHAGVYYVQEPSASAPCDLLDVQPGQTVLDLCAAPGGKTSRLAARLQGKGLLVANEFDAGRSQILRSNLERMGVPNALVLNETTTRVAKTFAGFFDRVLVDAPCSGEGMFRKEPQAVAQHSEALVQHCAEMSANILDDAAACVAPGGKLVLSTCTFSGEENEQQVAAFLARHPDFALLPVNVSFGGAGEVRRLADVPCEDIVYTRRIYPCHGGEGQFMAVFGRRNEPGEKSVFKKRKSVAMPTACKTFLQEYFPLLSNRECVCVGEQIFILPQTDYPATDKLHVVRAGVLAGSMEKGRFVPAHHLFMVYGAQCTKQLNLSLTDAAVAAWLHGEEIDAKTDENGWLCVLCEGAPLGAGKQSNKKIKNHYPKGCRNLK